LPAVSVGSDFDECHAAQIACDDSSGIPGRRQKGVRIPCTPAGKKVFTGSGSSSKLGFMKAVIRVRFKTLADRKSRARLFDAKRLASGKTTRRELQAENSCFSNAADYRVASNRSIYAHI
jgi:hypothetical protein